MYQLINLLLTQFPSRLHFGTVIELALTSGNEIVRYLSAICRFKLHCMGMPQITFDSPFQLKLLQLRLVVKIINNKQPVLFTRKGLALVTGW